MAKTTIIIKSAIIIVFDIFSTPFCKPKEHTRKPRIITITVQKIISDGTLSISEK